MPRKKHTPEEIVAKLRQVDVLVSQGSAVTDAIRQIGVTEVRYYRCCGSGALLCAGRLRILSLSALLLIGCPPTGRRWPTIAMQTRAGPLPGIFFGRISETWHSRA